MKRLRPLFTIFVLLSFLDVGIFANTGGIRVEDDGDVFWEPIATQIDDSSSAEQYESPDVNLYELSVNPAENPNEKSVIIPIPRLAFQLEQKTSGFVGKFFLFSGLQASFPGVLKRESSSRFHRIVYRAPIPNPFLVTLRSVVLIC